MSDPIEKETQTDPQDDKRDALLIAARDLFLKNTYANISIRKIADKAKVNSAMIAYYFGSKSGLFREMIKSYLESNLARLKSNMGHPDNESLEEFFYKFYNSMPSELVQLMVKTVIYERSEMRDWLLENLLSQIIDTADAYFVEMIGQGGRDADPAIMRTILQSLLVMPVLLYPTLQETIPEKMPEDFFKSLANVSATMITEYLKLEK